MIVFLTLSHLLHVQQTLIVFPYIKSSVACAASADSVSNIKSSVACAASADSVYNIKSSVARAANADSVSNIEVVLQYVLPDCETLIHI